MTDSLQHQHDQTAPPQGPPRAAEARGGTGDGPSAAGQTLPHSARPCRHSASHRARSADAAAASREEVPHTVPLGPLSDQIPQVLRQPPGPNLDGH